MRIAFGAGTAAWTSTNLFVHLTDHGLSIVLRPVRELDEDCGALVGVAAAPLFHEPAQTS